MKKVLILLCLMGALVGCDGIPRSGPIRHISLLEAKELLSKPRQSVSILDVRTPKEFEDGHLKGAVNENYYRGDFQDELNKLDKEAQYLVYCQSGPRGVKALKVMQKQGFKKVFHLYGGYDAWVAKGLPIVKSPITINETS